MTRQHGLLAVVIILFVVVTGVGSPPHAGAGPRR